MATKNGLMTVTTRTTPEGNQTAGLMVLDREAATFLGLLQLNSSPQADEAAMNATGFMKINFATGDGLMKAEENS